jgi:hypothetical protein
VKCSACRASIWNTFQFVCDDRRSNGARKHRYAVGCRDREKGLSVLSLQEISDRLEIQDLLARYSAAVDGRHWDRLDALFTDDAMIDYTETGGIRGTLAEQKAYLAEVLPSFEGTQHLTATSTIDLDGDTARVRTLCFNPMIVDDEHVFFVGLWYRDVLARTPEGWRFRERYEEKSYFHNTVRPN